MYTRGPDTGRGRVLTRRHGNGDDGAVADARMLEASMRPCRSVLLLSGAHICWRVPRHRQAWLRKSVLRFARSRAPQRFQPQPTGPARHLGVDLVLVVSISVATGVRPHTKRSKIGDRVPVHVGTWYAFTAM